MTAPYAAHPLASPLAWRLAYGLPLNPRFRFTPADISTLALDLDPHAAGALKTGGARQYTAANSETHSRADNTFFSMGDVDVVIVLWVYLDDKSATRNFLAKLGTIFTTANTEYYLRYEVGADRFEFGVSDGSAYGIAVDDTVGAPSTGTWYQLIGEHDATANTVSLYINTVLANTETGWTTGIQDSTQTFRLGSDTGVGSFHDGRLSRLLIAKNAAARALIDDATLRTWLYNNGNGRLSGELSAHATLGAFLDGVQMDSFNLNEASGNAISYSGLNDFTDNNTVTSADGPSVTTVADNTANNHDGVFSGSSDPNGIWKTDTPDESFNPTCKDESGNNRHVLLSGFSDGDTPRATGVESGVLGRLCNLDGSTQYGSARQPVLPAAADFSVCFRLRRETTGEEFFLGQTDGGANRFGIRFQADNTIAKFLLSGDRVVSATAITDTDWHNCVLTHKNSTGEWFLYLDDDAEQSAINTRTITQAADTVFGGFAGAGFQGDIADVRVYLRQLSAAESAAYIAKGSVDNTSLDLHLLFDEGNARNLGSDPGGSLLVNGSDDWVSVPDADDLDLDSAVIVRGWVKLDTVAGTQYILIKGLTTGAAYNYALRNIAGKLCYLWGNAPATDNIYESDDVVLTANAWHYVAVTHSEGSTPILYVDGTAVSGSMTSGAAGNLLETNANVLAIASNGGTGAFLDGYLSRIAGDNRVWTPTEVYDDYKLTTPSGLVADWPMDDGPQSPVADQDPVICFISNEGNRYQLLQEDPPKRPLARLAANGINGFTVLEFDGSNDLMRGLLSEMTKLVGLSGALYLVVRVNDASSAAQYVASASDEAGANDLIAFARLVDTVPATDALHSVYSRKSASDDRIYGSTDAATGVFVLGCESDGETYTLTVGTSEEVLTVVTGTNSGDWWNDFTGLDNFVLGALKRNTESQHAQIDLARCLIYDRKPSSTERTQLLNHLIAKYGATG